VTRAGATSKDAVRAFWEASPLMIGELPFEPATRDFFLAHEAIYRRDVFPATGFPSGFFPFPRGARVLDIGCGPGIWTRELARRGYATSAIDLTAAAVAITKRSLALFELVADVREGDAESLPFADGSFDGVISHGVIHHTPDTAGCVREIERVLRPGGRAVVSVYYRNLVLRSRLLSRLAGAALGGWVGLPGRGRDDLLRSGDPDEIVRRYDGAANPLGKAFTRTELRAMFDAAGLEVEAMRRFYFPLRAFGRAARLVAPAHRLLAERLGLMVAVTALKREAGSRRA